jgi:hypothetical protein
LQKISADLASAFLGQSSVKLSFFPKNHGKTWAVSGLWTAHGESRPFFAKVYPSLSKGVNELQTPEKYGQFLALFLLMKNCGVPVCAFAYPYLYARPSS